MKRIVFLMIIVLSALSSFCQVKIIEKKEITLGRNLITNEDIKTETFVLEESIKESCFNTETGDILLKTDNGSIRETDLRHTCHVGLFNVNDKKFRWINNYKFSNPKIMMKDNILICYNNGKSYRLDIETGKKTWKSKYKLEYLNTDNDIAVGYVSTNPNIIAAVDLNTGKTLWKKEMSHDLNLYDYIQTDNNNILLESSGLHYINIKDGSVCELEAEEKQNMLTEINMNIKRKSGLDIQYGLLNPEAYNNSKYKIHKKGLSLKFTDNNGNEVAIIDVLGIAYIFDDILCCIYNNTINFIDLGGL